jgi:hypothetical protein
MKIFGLTFAELSAITVFIGALFGGIGWAIRITLNPLHKAIEELSKDIKDLNQSRKENEGKLFSITEDHTKEISRIDGRVNTLEIMNQSTTLRLDRIEK